MNMFIRSFLQPLEKMKMTPAWNHCPKLNLKHIEKVAYIKAFSSKAWSLQVKPKEIVREPANTRTASIDTYLTT